MNLPKNESLRDQQKSLKISNSKQDLKSKKKITQRLSNDIKKEKSIERHDLNKQLQKTQEKF